MLAGSDIREVGLTPMFSSAACDREGAGAAQVDAVGTV